MASNVTAELGLKITAKDEATKVFLQFASSLKSSFADVISQNKEIQSALAKTASSVTKAANSLNGGNNSTAQGAAAARAAVDNLGNAGEGAAKKLDMKQVGAGFRELGSQAEHVSVPVLEFLGHAVDQGAKFQQQIDSIGATLKTHVASAADVTAANMQKMNDKAIQMGLSGLFSANQIADGMYVMAKQGVDYKTIMNGAMDSVQNLAAATDSDLSSTANVVTDIWHEMGDQMRKEFGPSTQEQFTQLSNVISGSMHNARISMGDFLNTLKYVGPQASAVGLGVKDCGVAISLLAEHGIKGTQAGTTLRRMLTDLAPTTKPAIAAMTQLGLITKDGENKFYNANGTMKDFVTVQNTLRTALEKLNPVQKEAALKAIFGQYALAGMNVVASATSEDMNTLTDDVTKNGNAAELSKEKWNNTAGDMKRFKAAIDTLTKAIGEYLLPIVTKIIEHLGSLVMWFGKLSPATQKNIVMIAAFGAAGLFAFDKTVQFVSGISSTIKAFKDIAPLFTKVTDLILNDTVKTAASTVVKGIATAATWLFNVACTALGATIAFLTSPIGIVIVIIAALVAAFVIAYKNSETFRNIVNGAIKGVADAFKAFIAWVTPAWNALWAAIKFTLSVVWQYIKMEVKVGVDLIMGVINIFKNLLSGNWKGAWDAVKNMTKNIIGDICGFLGGSVGKLVDAGLNLIKGFARGFANFHIPMPHMSVTGSFSLNPPSIPTVGVNWYAKGGIFNNPSVVGVGEAGPEAVLPIHKLGDLMTAVLKDRGIGTTQGSHTKNQTFNINVNVNGGGSGKDIGNDIARQIRTHMSVVSA